MNTECLMCGDGINWDGHEPTSYPQCVGFCSFECRKELDELIEVVRVLKSTLTLKAIEGESLMWKKVRA